MEKETQSGDAVRISRHYPAPPEKVWAAWTDPKALAQWFGADEQAVVTTAELDVRVGGRYHIVFVMPDGEAHDVSGVYQEVEATRRLAFSWAWRSTPGRVSRVGITLSLSGTGTDMAFVHDCFFDQQACDDHAKGWQRAFSKLDHLMGDAS